MLSCLLYSNEEEAYEDLPVLSRAFPEPGSLAAAAGSICGNRRNSDGETANVFGERRKRRRMRQERDKGNEVESVDSEEDKLGDDEDAVDGCNREKDSAACFVAEVLEELGASCSNS